MAPRCHFGAFVYTVGLLRCCGLTRGRNSVHKSPKMAYRCRFGAFVYTVALLWTDVGTQECTQMGGSGLSAPDWGVCVHCWAVALLRSAVGTQECTQIGENGPLAPFRCICVHCCDARCAAMRVATRAAGRCRARHRSAGLRRSAFQMNGKRLMGGSSRSCTPRRPCSMRFKALTRQSSLHTGFSALCLPAWQVA